ncbi:MAG: NUDIX hydrolase [Candidatus Hodarchaeales archaeon]
MPSYLHCSKQLQSTIQSSSRTVLDIPNDYKRAAVLVPIYIKHDEWHILFTRRTEKVTHHKNEISFPGGGYDEITDKNIIETALREVEEEIGCKDVEILGLLDDIFTISGYIVTPVVGKIPNSVDLDCNQQDSDEIQYIIKVPLEKVANASNFWTQEFPYNEGKLYEVPFFDYEGEIIWGATGRILLNFLRILTTLGLNCRKQFIGSHIWKE